MPWDDVKCWAKAALVSENPNWPDAPVELCGCATCTIVRLQGQLIRVEARVKHGSTFGLGRDIMDIVREAA